MHPNATIPDEKSTDLAAGAVAFPATRWSLVEKVRQGGAEAKLAHEELCRLYWYPIYAFLRSHGHSREDAEDTTQAFFLKLLASESVEDADRSKGKLRTFLLHVLKRHLVDERRHGSALKRGGGVEFISFEEMQAEARYASEPTDKRDPEFIFRRTWACELVAGVRQRLHHDFQGLGRSELFETLLPFLLWDEEPPSYSDVARKLQTGETAVRLLVFRLRGRFRDELRRHLSQTVDSAEEVESEIAWLREVLAI